MVLLMPPSRNENLLTLGSRTSKPTAAEQLEQLLRTSAAMVFAFSFGSSSKPDPSLLMR